MIVIVAHRLSTVKEADQILVLDEGVIVEKGDYDFLLKSEGVYSQLIKNQRG
jgi:ATP-binding cassette subfamily B protein